MTLAQLHKNVATAESNHERVVEKLYNCRLQRDAVAEKLSHTLDAFQHECARAILDDRTPDIAALTKQLAGLRTEQRARDNDVQAATDAVNLAEAAITAARGEIQTQRRAAAEAAISAIRSQYLDGQVKQAQLMGEMQVILAQHGYAGFELIIPQQPRTPNFYGSPDHQMWGARLPSAVADSALFDVRKRLTA